MILSADFDEAAARGRPRRRVVALQPSLFPWPGDLKKRTVSDIVVSLDSVKVQRNGFLHRYRMIDAGLPRWLTVPLERCGSGTLIADARVATAYRGWRDQHLRALAHWYRRAPHREEALSLVAALSPSSSAVVDLAEQSVRLVGEYLSLELPPEVRSSTRPVSTTGSALVRDVVLDQRGTCYLYGAGRKGLEHHYLDHDLLEDARIRLELISYTDLPYDQGDHPFVKRCSILDAIAWMGSSARDVVGSSGDIRTISSSLHPQRDASHHCDDVRPS